MEYLKIKAHLKYLQNKLFECDNIKDQTKIVHDIDYLEHVLNKKNKELIEINQLNYNIT